MSSTPETKLLREVMQYLSKTGVFHLRINNQGQYDKRLGRYRPSPYGHNGVADVLVIAQGQPVFVELKAPKGRLSPDQILFKRHCEEHAIEYEVVRTLDELINLGLKR